MTSLKNLVSLSKGNPFELFFELSADLLCIAGFDGYFKKINPAVVKLLGYTSDELMARPINDFVYEDDKNITQKVRRDLIGGEPVFNFENRYVTKSGDIVWLSWTSMNIDSDRLVFAVAKDVTIKKKLEEERNTLLINMTSLNKKLEHLSYTTSHDLRAPVNNLLSLFELLDTTQIADEDTLELIKVLRAASVNLQQTLNGYVDKLKEKQSVNLPLEEISLSGALETVMKSIASLVRNSRAVINADFSEVSSIFFNKEYLHSILLNLLTNSMKYAKTDCLPVITITSKRVNGIRQLIVSDNCIGFDMEKVKDRIFGLHQKFHEHADSKGIGLYLVYNHVVSLGGTISLESKPNEGATFIISFRD